MDVLHPLVSEFEKEAAIEQRRPPSKRMSLLEPHILPADNYIIRSTPTLVCLASALRRVCAVTYIE